MKRLLSIFSSIVIALGLVGCSENKTNFNETSNMNVSTLEEVPDHSKQQEGFIYLNENIPNFTEEQKQDTDSRIILQDLDFLGRCGPAYEVVSQEMLPTEERKDISGVYPTGWHQEFYGDRALYNRSHLLAHSISGLNDEKRNLITGTAQMNQEVMTVFESEVREYVKNTSNHVVYRVTPDFRGEEMVARGVQMEAWSVEDAGKGVCFNVYVYNVQDNVNIDYETGYSSSSDYVQEKSDQLSYRINPDEKMTFVINTNNGKFHTTDCGNAKRVGAGNRQELVSTVKDMETNGYDPAGCCIK